MTGRLQADSRQAQRRHEPGRNGDGAGQRDGEYDRDPIDVQRVDPHHLAWAKAREAAHRAVGECESQGPRGRRQQQGLNQQLADQTRAARTERAAHGELLTARRSARQQQVGHVDAGDQEHRDYRRAKQSDGRTHVTDQVLAQRDHFRAHALVRARVLLLDDRGDRIHLRLRLFDRDAVLQPTDDVPVAAGPDPRLVFLHGLRGVDVAIARSIFLEVRLEIIRHHARDEERTVIERDRLADDARIAVEVRSPEVFGEHDDAVVALGVLLGPEETAGERLNAKGVEEAFGDEHGLEHFGTLAAGVVEAVRIDAGELLEAGGPGAPVEEIAWRDVAAAGRVALPLKQRDDPFRIGVGKRAQQDLRDDAERRDRRRHAERKDADRGDRKAGLLAPLAEAVTQIVDRLQIGDVALANPERIDERSEGMPHDRRCEPARRAGGAAAESSPSHSRRHSSRSRAGTRRDASRTIESARWSDSV